MGSARFTVSSRQVAEGAKAAVAALLCVLMVDQPLFAMAPGEPAKIVRPAAQVQGQERALHALNRLTFGPRPGDVAAVQAMGLKAWFEAQLNPGSIDDSKLEARLAEYPAMQLPLDQLEARFPSPQRLKQLENGKGQLPTDPAERAMVMDQMAFYKKAQKLQAGVAAKAPDAGDGMMSSGVAGGGPTHDDKAVMNGAQGVAAGPTHDDKAVMNGAQDPMVAARKKQKQVQAGLSTLMSDDGDAMQNKPLAAAEVSAQEPMAAVPDQNGRALAMKMAALPVDQRLQAIMALPPDQLVSMRQSLQGPQLGMLTVGMTPVQKEMLTALPAGCG